MDHGTTQGKDQIKSENIL